MEESSWSMGESLQASVQTCATYGVAAGPGPELMLQIHTRCQRFQDGGMRTERAHAAYVIGSFMRSPSTNAGTALKVLKVIGDG